MNTINPMLTHDQLAELRKKLEEKEKELGKEITSLEETPDFGSDVDSFEEETNEAEGFSTNAGIGNAMGTRREDIAHALRKMSEGKYGMCEECGKAIDYELLTIDPESRLCKACKQGK
ncbi:MAG: TraR/DksA C4-type zinc finger protein [Patescibacteria group bacterium]